MLAEAGYRVVVPYLRGYGSTRFRSSGAVRNGQQAALAADAIALLDALDIPTAIVAGFDWGARTADVVAALWPERCTGLVAVSGYLIGSQEANKQPLPPSAELAWWYQFYFATDRGRAGYERYRRDFARLIWRSASPSGTSTRPRSIEARPPSTTRITSTSSSTTTAGGSASSTASRATTISRHGWPRPDHRRADDHAGRRRERRAAPRRRGLPREVHRPVHAPGHLRVASGTTCPRRHRGPSPTPWSRSIPTERRPRFATQG